MPGLRVNAWHLGEHVGSAGRETAALLRAIDIGSTHFDTAEMYGDGATMVQACEGSLRRLQTD